MKRKIAQRIINTRVLLLFSVLLVGVLLVISTSSIEAQSEDGVIVVQGTYDNGFASMEWDRFVPAPIPGDPYCIRHQASSETPNFDLVLDLGQGTFSGSVSGKAQAEDLLQRIKDIQGHLAGIKNP